MSEKKLTCPHCGEADYPGAKFCRGCGREFDKATLQTDWRSATYDGRRLSEWMDDLVSHDGGKRVRAAAIFETLGAEVDGVVKYLLDGLKTGERWHRLMPAESLLQIGKHTKLAAKTLVDAIENDSSKDVRMTAMGSIMKNGAKAAEAAPMLVELLGKTYEYERQDVPELAAEALGWTGVCDDYAIQALKKASDSLQTGLSKAAKNALKRLQKTKR